MGVGYNESLGLNGKRNGRSVSSGREISREGECLIRGRIMLYGDPFGFDAFLMQISGLPVSYYLSFRLRCCFLGGRR